MAGSLILSCKALLKVTVQGARRAQHTQHCNALLRLWSSADSAEGNETDLLAFQLSTRCASFTDLAPQSATLFRAVLGMFDVRSGVQDRGGVDEMIKAYRLVFSIGFMVIGQRQSNARPAKDCARVTCREASVSGMHVIAKPRPAVELWASSSMSGSH